MPPRLLGNLLVSAQFATLAMLTWMAWRTSLPAADLGATWVLLGLSVMLGLWALSANRPGNFNIHPIPHQQGKLVVHGPYHWIRHPMYTSVLLFGAALAVAIASPTAWLFWGVSAGVLVVKAWLEERWLTSKHPAYQTYLEHSRRFVPYLL